MNSDAPRRRMRTRGSIAYGPRAHPDRWVDPAPPVGRDATPTCPRAAARFPSIPRVGAAPCGPSERGGPDGRAPEAGRRRGEVAGDELCVGLPPGPADGHVDAVAAEPPPVGQRQGVP